MWYTRENLYIGVQSFPLSIQGSSSIEVGIFCVIVGCRSSYTTSDVVISWKNILKMPTLLASPHLLCTTKPIYLPCASQASNAARFFTKDNNKKVAILIRGNFEFFFLDINFVLYGFSCPRNGRH